MFRIRNFFFLGSGSLAGNAAFTKLLKLNRVNHSVSMFRIRNFFFQGSSYLVDYAHIHTAFTKLFNSNYYYSVSDPQILIRICIIFSHTQHSPRPTMSLCIKYFIGNICNNLALRTIFSSPVLVSVSSSLQAFYFGSFRP